MKTPSKRKRFSSAVALLLAFVFILSSCVSAPNNSDNNDGADTDNGNTGTDTSGSGGLPSIYINTRNNKQITSKTEYTDVAIKFELNDLYSECTNAYTENAGRAQLRCRGNSSYGKKDMQAKNKYSYKLRLYEKADLFGMGESRHWYLLANWFDVTHMRNKLAYDLSGVLGMTYTESTWVKLYYDGEYRGIYSLVESIRIDEGRVETFDWEDFAEDTAEAYGLRNQFSADKAEALSETMKSDLSWITTQKLVFNYKSKAEFVDLRSYFDTSELDLTSGYLIEYDGRLDGDNTKWSTAMGLPVVMDSPASLSTNDVMLNYVKTLIQDFEDALFSPTYHNAKGYHYSEYVDVESLVDFWIIWNLFNNIEFGYLSIYYYIDDGKIIFGPCWDFDNATGNIVTLKEKWEKWDYWVNDRGNNNDGWFSQVVSDPYFVAMAQERWYSMREPIDDMMRSLDIYYDYIGEEAVKCYERNGPRENWYLKDRNGGKSYDFETDFALLKDWLTNRIKWIDENFSSPTVCVDESVFERSDKLFISFPSGTTVEKDLANAYGVTADYIIPTGLSSPLSFYISTTHTSAKSVEVLLNGSHSLGKKSFNDKTPASFSIDPADLRLKSGSLNSLIVIAYKQNGAIRSMTSFTIEASSHKNPSKGKYAVSFGEKCAQVTAGESITAPDITAEREGFTALGWTLGDGRIYKPGDSFTPESHVSFYICWQRDGIDSKMSLEW